MRKFMMFFRKEDWQVTGYYPYTSHVSDTIIGSGTHKENDDFLKEIWEHIWEKAEALGCQMDNKIVLQITRPNTMKGYNSENSILYIGMYDNGLSLGLGLWQDSWLKDKNIHFPIQ